MKWTLEDIVDELLRLEKTYGISSVEAFYHYMNGLRSGDLDTENSDYDKACDRIADYFIILLRTKEARSWSWGLRSEATDVRTVGSD